jgi:recombinational DNA repair ATPase RecF
MKLNSLHLRSFRGATQPITLHFSERKNITLIYAENGNGKSTIADALVSLCTDEVGSLADRSDVDRNFLKSLGSKSSDLLIELVTDKGTYKATLASSSNRFVKSPNSNLPKLKSLRRAQITSFIEDQPSERYKVISSFIDVSGVQKSENELKRLILNLEQNLLSSSKSLSVAKENLTRFWKGEGSPKGSVDEWIKDELGKDYSKLATELGMNSSVLEGWTDLLGVVRNMISEKDKYLKSRETLKTADEKLREYIKTNPSSESDLLALLNEAKDYLTSKRVVDKCPMCGKNNERAHLLRHVSSAIEQMETLNKLVQAQKSARSIKDNLYQRLQSHSDLFTKSLIAFKTLTVKVPGSNIKNIFKEIVNSNTVSDNFKKFNAISSEVSAVIANLKSQNQSISKSIHLSNSIKVNSESSQKLQEEFSKSEKMIVLAKSTLQLLESERKTFIDTELSSISAEVENMYHTIHPNEGLGNVRLFLNHNYQGSLNLTADFYSANDITPQSLYSESHLDTLGICIFLALAKKESNKDVILILDDVVMSVDERHLDRIIDLIHTQSEFFSQIFISTHYRPWRERYRNNRAPNSNIQFVELRSWSKENGIRIAKPMLVLNEIQEFLSDPSKFHREHLASTTGRFLEALLDFLTLNFGCRLKRRPTNDYTLSDLLDSFSKDLLKLMKVQRMMPLLSGGFEKDKFLEEVYLKDTIDAIKNLKAVRNQVGAHYTFEGALVSDNDIEDFAKLTIQLATLLTCPVNGNLPDKKNSGSFWETKIGSIRLFPLVEP